AFHPACDTDYQQETARPDRPFQTALGAEHVKKKKQRASRTGRSTRPSRYGRVRPPEVRSQYASFRRRVIDPSGARASGAAVNGPVPDVPRAIPACGAARWTRNGPNGARSSNRTVLPSSATTRLIADGSSKSSRYARVPRPRSKL